MEIERWSLAGRPAVGPGDSAFVAVSHPDLAENHYHSSIFRLERESAGGVGDPSAGASADPDQQGPTGAKGLVRFTRGPRDSSPALSPDGRLVVFLRTGEGSPQLFAMPTYGGEARPLATHPLGAGPAIFSPDGSRIAYLAAVPESGRYGTAEGVSADAEPPRRINRLAYRLDDKGFLLDRPEQLFVQELAGDPMARQLTAEPAGVTCPAFTPDGHGIVLAREAGPDRLDDEIFRVDLPAVDDPVDRLPEVIPLVRPPGDVRRLTVAGDRVHYIGARFEGGDYPGRNPGLWSAPLSGGDPVRLTDERTVHVEAAGGPPVPVGDRLLVVVLDRGSACLAAVPSSAREVPLDELDRWVDGPRSVLSFDAAGDRLLAVVADATSQGEVHELALDSAPRVRSTSVLTDLAAGLRVSGIARQLELTGTAPDGYPVHGFLVLPDPAVSGDGPYPVLLDVHGGPHAAYGWGLFDEAQVYAAAGYAVVLPNPRGSAGYGHDHGRTVIHRLGTVDVDDVLALLDAAVRRADCAADRVGVMGGSYGGFMTSWLASHTPDRFVAGISERALNAWDSFAGSSDIGYYFARTYVGDDRDAQWAASPLSRADAIDIPLLIIHSEQDWRCPVEQGQRLYTALKRRDAQVELLLFPGEGHELSRSGRPAHRVQRFEVILGWWERWLGVGARVERQW